MLLDFLEEAVEDIFKVSEATLFCMGSPSNLARSLGMGSSRYHSSMQSLRRSGYIKKVNENQFLITPKGIEKAQRYAKEHVVFDAQKWKGTWVLVVFDIPDSKKRQRNIFRSILKRMGFIGLQRSVFIAPFADFEKLAIVRDHLDIANFVTVFTGNVSAKDDDQKLRAEFKLPNANVLKNKNKDRNNKDNKDNKSKDKDANR